MIYYTDRDLVIRSMQESDARIFTDEETAQGWHADISKYLEELKDQADGKCISLTAEYRGNPAGYVQIYRTAKDGPFRGPGIPEIVDLGVLEKYRRQGIGSRLMDTAERIAGSRADTVCLGVGLHDGYGSAQRMYIKRGYIPDGSGVWYRDRPCTPYDTIYTNDDDLILYLSKKLPRTQAPEAGRNVHQAAGEAQRASAADAGTIAALACELWPEHDPVPMKAEFESLLSGKDSAVFLYRKNGQAVGFAQCQLRHDYVEGTETSPVGYLEGIYVKPGERRKGIARSLLLACEGWAKDQGCTEFASDCELSNTESQEFHRSVGFREANRIVAYVRKL